VLPRRRSRQTNSVFQELNIAPYMNLMAVLIPFLLSVVVFTRLATLEIYLPQESNDPLEDLTELKEDFLLTVTITDEGLIVANGEKIIGFVAPSTDGTQYKELSKILQDLKDKFPEEENAIILSKPMIPYGMLVSVMDMVQTVPGPPRKELFPSVSLGEVQ